MSQLTQKTNNTLIQLVRYFFVGGAAFCIDYSTIYILSEYLCFHHLVSAAIAFLLGLITNYTLSIVWVFGRNKNNSFGKEFLIFSIIGLIGLLLNELIIYLGSDVLGLHYMLSKLCSTAIVFFWNFFARKIILFNNK